MAKLDLGKVVGDDGYSPTVETSKSGKVTTITITDVNGTHTATILDGEDGAAASGDMKKEVYDTNNNGIVDNAEKVNNHTVEKDVPANAVFTDTTYSAATTEANGLMSSTDKTKLNGIASGAEANVQVDWNESSSSSDAYIKNKPTIPAEVTETTVANWGFTKNTGDYSKPSGGIPSSDLSSGVQTSLGKADSAIQNTDYATSNTGGVIKNGYNTSTDSNGYLYAQNRTYSQYQTDSVYGFISKGTLEAVITGKNLKAIQYDTMPTASADNLGDIVQYIGASVANSYTNGYFYKCVSDGASTPTYSWENINVQAGGGGTTYTAGDNITISNNVISATDTTYSNATTETAGLMSTDDKTKLNGIASGAEVNVQADWNESDTSSDAYIQNKPTILTAPDVVTSSDSTYTIASLVGNKSYKLSTITSLTISATTTFDIETVIYFVSGSTPTDVSLPASITNLGDAPTMTTASSVNTGTCVASKSYIISVLNNIAIWRAY